MSGRPALLIVDDNENNRDVLSRRLALKGYDVAVAAGGDEALGRIASESFDLILLDVEMPGMSGFDVLSRVRESHSATELPVIMVTARTEGADVVEAFRLGANDYVTKPIDFPVALARIGTHVSHRRAIEDLHESRERLALAMQAANDGLANRALFVELLDRAIKRTTRRPGYAFAVLVLEVDRFRMVSGSLGSVTADRLLVSVAQRLQAGLRSTDAVERPGFTLARLGGNEFTVLLDDISGARDAVRVAMRLRHVLEKPFDVDGYQLFTSATVGIAVSTTGYQHPEEILRDATTALHRAQHDSTSSCELFDPMMRDQAVARLRLETDLRHGIEAGAFVVHYQPIVSLGSGRIEGFEALVRWNHPARGIVGPVEFMDVAEDTGMIVPIGRQVLGKACRQMAMWQRQFGDLAPASICVNVSARQFAESNLADEVEAVLHETGLSASCLKLEITESAFIGDVGAAQVTLKRLQSIGVEWSLDDFGTGYSSLNHLHQLHVNTVKIDRSFVSRLGVDEGGTEMVRVIVALAHNLSMDVVAEGVESEDQWVRLRALGCEFTQGFHFSRPVDAAAAEALIAAQPWSIAALEAAC
jgi:diguanylate cyclase (GGDEF)-like protein